MNQTKTDVMMDPTIKSDKKDRNIAYYLKALVGLAIMIFFGYLPAPEPITPAGMAVLGLFIGLIFLWTFVDMVWPTLAVIVLFGFVAKTIYPDSWALAGIYEAGAQSIGSWVILLVLGLMLFVEVLRDTGIIRRISLWFITRNVAKKGPWAFTFMFLLAAYVVGLFLNVTAAQLLLFALAKEVFSVTGMDKDDKWTKVITIGITFTVVIGYAATPFCHDLSILFMGIYAAIAKESVNWLAYMLIALPVATLAWLGLVGFLRFIVRPDMSKLKNIDFSKVEALRPGPMSKKEKFVVYMVGLLFISWVVPGFLGVLVPNASITHWFDMITMATPMYVILVIFAIVRFDGKPVLDIAKAAGRLSWLIIFFLAGIMLIATAMGEQTTGIPQWTLQFFTPIVQNMSPFMMVAMLGAISVILTNIANNVPTGIILITIGVPLSLQMGINPFITAVAVCVGAQFSYAIPPAFVPIGFCYADPFGGAKYTFRWGVVMTIFSAVLCGLLIYPIGNLIF